MSRKIEDYTGKVFGYLTVIKYAGIIDGSSHWDCLCKCGVTCTKKHNNLKRGSTKSCGCYRQELVQANLYGQRFGYLTVIDKHGFEEMPLENLRPLEKKANMSKGTKIIFQS